MKHLKLIGLALLAMLALSATTIANTASAATPELLPGKGTSFTDKGGEGTLRTLGGKAITCKKNTSKGEAISTKLGTFEIKFEGCSAEKGTVNCTGLKDAAGNITVKTAKFHIWGGLLTEKEVTAFVVLLGEAVHFECSALVLANIEKGSCLAGLLKELDKLVKTLTVLFSESKPESGDPDIPNVFESLGKPGGEKEKECALKQSTNGGKPESGAMKQEDSLEGFKKETKEITVLIDS